MDSEYRRMIKDIKRHRDLEQNLPEYGNAYINSVYEYNMIRLVLNYYTLKEVLDEGGIDDDGPVGEAVDKINEIIFKVLMEDEDIDNDSDILKDIDDLRNQVTGKMIVLTAYTDALQIFEYVLNRIEYGITKDTYPVDVKSLSERLFKYIFNNDDKLVVNSKIQMITAQLPVRMAKSKFYDYLSETLNIYKGTDKESVNSFVDMMKSTAVLERPEGYEKLYPEIYSLIDQLEHMDFKTVDRDTYLAVMEQFGFTSAHLTDIVSNHLMLMEIINALYSILLALPFQRSDEESVQVCTSMIKSLHASFAAGGEIPDSVDEEFYKIEGIQEQLGEDIIQFESVLMDVYENYSDEISWIMADELFGRLDKIAKLMSNSLFIELDADMDADIADADYIKVKRDELVKDFSEYFESHPKEINRAVMGAVFSNMPVLFNSVDEIKDYIEHSLSHCSNDSELMACTKLLDEMMEEE